MFCSFSPEWWSVDGAKSVFFSDFYYSMVKQCNKKIQENKLRQEASVFIKKKKKLQCKSGKVYYIIHYIGVTLKDVYLGANLMCNCSHMT